MSGELWVSAPDGVPEVRAGDDLCGLLLDVLEPADGDVVVVTSKAVSKAEGRVREGGPAEREAALREETTRLVAWAGPTAIVRSRLGVTMAAAGIDESHIEPGRFALLPEDPDASARALRAAIADRTGRNVAVVVTDTAGRAWRLGQVDFALGAAGIAPLEDLRGEHDAYGQELVVTMPAVADELAAAAELAAGKLGARPFVRVRGRADLVLPVGDDGPGARALVREPVEDLFGYGAREAVLAALRGGDAGGFGRPATPDDLASVLGELVPDARVEAEAGRLRVRGGEVRLASALARAHAWVEVAGRGDDGLLLEPM